MTAIGRVIAGAGFGIGVALLLVACIGGPDCGAIDEIRSYPSAAPERIVLDVAHPVAEQGVTVHLNAAALPADASFDARLYVLAADDPDAEPTPAPSAPSSEPAHRAFEVTDRGRGHRRGHPGERALGGVDLRCRSTVRLDPDSCSAGIDVRSRVSPPVRDRGRRQRGRARRMDLQTRVTYVGVHAPCGMPSGARTELGDDAAGHVDVRPGRHRGARRRRRGRRGSHGPSPDHHHRSCAKGCVTSPRDRREPGSRANKTLRGDSGSA